VVSFAPRPLYIQGKSSWCPLDRRLGGIQNQSEEKNSQPLTGIEPWILRKNGRKKRMTEMKENVKENEEQTSKGITRSVQVMKVLWRFLFHVSLHVFQLRNYSTDFN
jgi:hypothetical protein